MTTPKRRIHVLPTPRGSWVLLDEARGGLPGRYPSETEAERVARRAARGEAAEVVVHDRYHRVHRATRTFADPR